MRVGGKQVPFLKKKLIKKVSRNSGFSKKTKHKKEEEVKKECVDSRKCGGIFWKKPRDSWTRRYILFPRHLFPGVLFLITWTDIKSDFWSNQTLYIPFFS